MGLDIGKWWRERATRLPASKNSLSDILGEDLATALKGAGRTSIERELDALFLKVNVGMNGIAGLVVTAVHRALGNNVPPVIGSVLEAVIADAIRKTHGETAGKIKDEVQRAVFRVLKL